MLLNARFAGGREEATLRNRADRVAACLHAAAQHGQELLVARPADRVGRAGIVHVAAGQAGRRRGWNEREQSTDALLRARG